MHFTEVNNILNQAFFATLKDPHLRHGQALMNALSEVDFDLYRKVSATPEVDPFYNDELIHAFFDFITDPLTQDETI